MGNGRRRGKGKPAVPLTTVHVPVRALRASGLSPDLCEGLIRAQEDRLAAALRSDAPGVRYAEAKLGHLLREAAPSIQARWQEIAPHTTVQDVTVVTREGEVMLGLRGRVAPAAGMRPPLPPSLVLG